jgi:hypothetical protein
MAGFVIVLGAPGRSRAPAATAIAATGYIRWHQVRGRDARRDLSGAYRAYQRRARADARRLATAPAGTPRQGENAHWAPGSTGPATGRQQRYSKPGRPGGRNRHSTCSGSPRPGAFLAAAEAGIDHLCGDHVSFFTGMGFDGLVQATALAALHPTLPIYTGVYLLPLRHPVLVARQLADIERLAPGRLIFGVGVGGEDRHEVSICGVDPATRGLRMNECLTIVRELLTGKPTTFHGTFFDLDEAVIGP